MKQENGDIKYFGIEVGNSYRKRAIIEVCNKRNINYHWSKMGDTIHFPNACMAPIDIARFLDEINETEQKLKPILNISLSNEQKEVLSKVMDMLADANIGLAHDYHSTGQLVAFNSNNGTAYTGCDGENKDDEEWVNMEDVKGDFTYLPIRHNGKRVYSFFSNEGFAYKKD